ncbi:MAG TPA: sulfotransferase [Steroidobacteraceae bacterium]|nr:sulfotransferase [Steroidobacteraceae bacterium]
MAKGVSVHRQDRTLGPGSPGRAGKRPLDPQEMLAAALKRAGRTGFDDRSFLHPLQRLIASCNTESDLNALGRNAVKFEIRRSLHNLLEFERRERESPQVLKRPIERPVFITGMPRSGSTFLHRLLVRDPAVAAPLSWRLVHPHPSAAGRVGEIFNRVKVQAQFYLMRLLAPELNSLHEVAAGEPEECTDITAQVFQSLRYDSVYRVPSYQSWLQRHGHLDAYRFHKRFLQHLEHLEPPGAHRRWILKSPDHVFALEDIRVVYPDAVWVFIHRDPVAVLASVARLTEVLRRPFAHRVDLREIGQQVCASWVDGAERMMRTAANSDSILHLHYREIISDPQKTASRVFRHCGHGSSREAARRMRKWLGNRANRSHRPRSYDLASFGLDPNTLRARFKPYTDAFDIELEWPPKARAVRAPRN